MQNQYIYHLRPDVTIQDNPEGGFHLKVAMGQLEIRSQSPVVRTAVDQMMHRGATEDELINMLLSAGEGDHLALFLYSLEQIKRSGLIVWTIGTHDRTIAKLHSISTLFRPQSQEIQPDQTYQLSRFAFMRSEGGKLVLESSCAYARIELNSSEAVSLLGMLHQPTSLNDLFESEYANLRVLAETLLGLGVLVRVNEEGIAEEDEDPALQQWEFHDLLFHSRSRMGRHRNPSGATYPFRGIASPTPALKAMPEHLEQIPLARPDIEQLMQTDKPFTQVLESRRSVRKYDTDPITVEELGEFLYRACRLRDLHPIDDERGQFYETSSRPYPNGGASYEFELYLTVNQCQGLESGLYHYDPQQHLLRKLRERDIFVDALLMEGYYSAAQTTYPQILITYAPRFQRLSWKYRGMGYSASLKNAGALYQTMYLVATAMELGPCGLGNGNAELLSRAAGTNYYLESSTAEFMLGSRPKS